MSPEANPEQSPGGSEEMSDEEMRRREEEAAELLGEDWEKSAETPGELDEQAKAAQGEVEKGAAALDEGHQDALGKIDELPGKVDVDAEAAQGPRVEAEQELGVVGDEAAVVAEEAESGIDSGRSGEEPSQDLQESQEDDAEREKVVRIQELLSELRKTMNVVDDYAQGVKDGTKVLDDTYDKAVAENQRLNQEFNDLDGHNYLLELQASKGSLNEPMIDDVLFDEVGDRISEFESMLQEINTKLEELRQQVKSNPDDRVLNQSLSHVESNKARTEKQLAAYKSVQDNPRAPKIAKEINAIGEEINEEVRKPQKSKNREKIKRLNDAYSDHRKMLWQELQG